MSFKDIVAGDYVAKPVGVRFIKSPKTGTVGLETMFKFKVGANEERLSWVGWLTENALENSMKTYVEVLGFNGNENHDANGVLTDPKAINYEQEVKLVIEMEQYEGKERAKIKWVNNLGGSGFVACEPETVKNHLGAIGFKAAFLSAKQAMGQPKAPTESSEPKPDPFDESKLPF